MNNNENNNYDALFETFPMRSNKYIPLPLKEYIVKCKKSDTSAIKSIKSILNIYVINLSSLPFFIAYNPIKIVHII